MNNKYIILSGLLILCLGLGSCADFLDRQPLDKVTPGEFFKTDSHLAAYAIGRYGSFATKGGFGLGPLTYDNHTDNMASTGVSESRWVPEKWLTSQNGSISFGDIRQANYFLVNVLPKYESGQIQGSPTRIKHYIGEMFFFRAQAYFDNLVSFGDFPILTELLPDDKDILIANSVRQPRNEVARFILKDLDKAIEFMSNDASVTSNKNRLSKNAALLFKSRVALFEASWLRYHAGTARVPNGPEWPGKRLYPNYQFPGGSIESEVDFFLKEAISSSKELISIPLQDQGAAKINPDPESTSPRGWNTYFEMFGDVDMSKYKEVIFWRQYDVSLSVTHGTSLYIRRGGNTGLTKGYVDSFLMNDGNPYYASDKYKGDKSTDNVRANRDSRLQLFMLSDQDRFEIEPAENGEVSLFKDQKLFPFIINLQETKMVTGYGIRKGFNLDPKYLSNGPLVEDTGSIVYRVAEAYLNFIEASYMLNNSLGAEARKAWGDLRERAGMPASSIDITIQNTNLDIEAKGDWAVYSAGQQIDATLYNIRRERRCEFIGEGMRWNDLLRWCSLNQVKDYIVEGFNLWDENYNRYIVEQKKKDKDGNETSELEMLDMLIQPGTAGKTANVSSKSDSKYLLPYRIQKENNNVYNGYTFRQAKYLSPIPIRHIELASPSESVDDSNYYQNPGWPLVGNAPALKSSNPLDN